MPTVNMHEAKSRLSKLVESVETGEEVEIVIARNGTPVARLVPIDGASAHDVSKRLGIAEGQFGHVSFEEFKESDAEIARLMTEGPLFPDEVEQPLARRKKSA